MFNLTQAFSPPGNYEPEYVIVTYTYPQNEDKIWFWSKSIAYYMFPMDVLQRLSFYLSKDKLKYQQHVRVTLDNECFGVSNDYMKLLTQNVSYY